jgi:hypothetical protein
MRRTELKRITPLGACTKALRRTELARKTAIKPGTKRMRQSRSTDKPTTQQAARWALMRKIGCVACLLNKQIGMKVTRMVLEHHHQTDSGRRIGHDETVELCRHHHQGDKFPMIDAGYKANAAVYGPSYGKEPARFRLVYGADEELLEFQNALLAQASALMGEG